MTHTAQQATLHGNFNLPPDTIIQDEHIFLAIDGHSTHRVFPGDHEYHRTWLMCGSRGSVTIHDAGNGWSQIITVEADTTQDELAFWNRLAALISEHPNHVQDINPGLVTHLLTAAGIYDPSLLINS